MKRNSKILLNFILFIALILISNKIYADSPVFEAEIYRGPTYSIEPVDKSGVKIKIKSNQNENTLESITILKNSVDVTEQVIKNYSENEFFIPSEIIDENGTQFEFRFTNIKGLKNKSLYTNDKYIIIKKYNEEINGKYFGVSRAPRISIGKPDEDSNFNIKVKDGDGIKEFKIIDLNDENKEYIKTFDDSNTEQIITYNFLNDFKTDKELPKYQEDEEYYDNHPYERPAYEFKIQVIDKKDNIHEETMKIYAKQEYYDAKIGNKYYKNIQEAIAAVPNNKEKTIEILKDVRITRIYIWKNKKIKLDLRKHTITGDALINLYNEGTLQIEGEGKIVGILSTCIHNCGTLQINNVIIRASANKEAIVNTHGNVALNDATITGRILNQNRGKITINRGTITKKIKNKGRGNLVITNAKIKTNTTAIFNYGKLKINESEIESNGEYAIKNYKKEGASVSIKGGTIKAQKGKVLNIK